jgi:hypothetical protein
VAKTPKSESDSEPPRQFASVPPPQDLYQTSDIRFVMHEVGKLVAKVDRLIEDVGKHGDKIDGLRHQVTFVKGALWVIGFLILAFGAVATWYFTGKIVISLHQ